MRRLSAEELRDSVLATSGDLNLEKFGPSFYPDVADEVKAGQSRPERAGRNLRKAIKLDAAFIFTSSDH